MRQKKYALNVKKAFTIPLINLNAFDLIMNNMMIIVLIIKNNNFQFVQSVNQDTTLEIICVWSVWNIHRLLVVFSVIRIYQKIVYFVKQITIRMKMENVLKINKIRISPKILQIKQLF